MADPRKPRQRTRREQITRSKEWRRLNAGGIELRDSTTGPDSVTLSGTAMVYEVAYDVADMYGTFSETMHTGCASMALADPACDIRLLLNHSGLPIARTVSGTLVVNDSIAALNWIATLDPNAPTASDVISAIERGDLSQCSIGMVVASDVWSADYEQRDIYALSEIFDISCVTYPASTTTQVEILHRMMAGIPTESRERVRRMWSVAKTVRQEVREGKVLSQANVDALTQVLETLATADDVNIPDIIEELETLTGDTSGIVADLQVIDGAIDDAQAAVSDVLDTANPDSDDDDEDATDEMDSVRSTALALEMELLSLRAKKR